MIIDIRNSYQPGAGEYDLTVFIDVFRASTTLLYIFRSGALEVIGVNRRDVIDGYLEKGYRLVSEVYGDGIDNSPSLIMNSSLAGVRVLQKTGNLTTAIFNNLNFKKAIVAGFVNLDAAAEYIKGAKIERVEIVAASNFEEKKEDVEDISCATAIKSLIEGLPVGEYYRMDRIREKIGTRKSGTFQFPDNYWFDLELALERNTVPLVPEVIKNGADEVRFELAV